MTRLCAKGSLATRSIFRLVLFSLGIIPGFQALDNGASVTIDQYPDYDHQRICGKGCLQNNWDSGDDIEKELGCTWNGCYCGTQYQPAATSILKSCWTAYCGTKESSLLSYDISTALSIYNAYCNDGQSEDGLSAFTTIFGAVTSVSDPKSTNSLTNTANLATPNSTSSELQTAMRTVTGNVFVVSTSYLTVTYSQTSAISSSYGDGTVTTNNSEQKHGRYSTADQIALGVGLGLGIPTLIATLWLCCLQTRRHPA